MLTLIMEQEQQNSYKMQEYSSLNEQHDQQMNEETMLLLLLSKTG